MFTLPYIIAGLIGTSGLILLVIAGVDWLFIKKKESKPKKQFLPPPPPPSISKELVQAHNHAEAIVRQAVDKAEGIVAESTLFNKDILTEVNTNLRHVAEETVEKFKEQARKFDMQYEFMFQHIEEEYRKKATGTIASMEQVVTAELQEFKEIIKQETLASQHIISEKIQTEFTHIQQELITYRETKYKEIDTSIAKSLSEITEEVLGKSLSPTDQEKLIMTSLDKAKAEGMFGN